MHFSETEKQNCSTVRPSALGYLSTIKSLPFGEVWRGSF